MHNSYSKGLLKSSYVPICVPICHIVYVSSVAAGPSCLHFMLTNIQRSKLTYMSCLFGRHASYTCHVLRIWRCENIWNTIYYISLCQKASNFHSTIQLQQLLQWMLDVKIFPQITKNCSISCSLISISPNMFKKFSWSCFFPSALFSSFI